MITPQQKTSAATTMTWGGRALGVMIVFAAVQNVRHGGGWALSLFLLLTVAGVEAGGSISKRLRRRPYGQGE